MKALRVPWVFAAIIGMIGLWAVWHPQQPFPAPGQAVAAERGPTAGDQLGYSAAFEAEVQRIGQITPQQFARRMGGKVQYVKKPSWDPTTAKFWDGFNLDPNQQGQQVRVRGGEEREQRDLAQSKGKPLPADKPVLQPTQGLYDFRLNDPELTKFKENGFVVSERMGAPSCTEMFYRIYKRDLPVFVTADAVLHAWHRSYDAILEEVETHMLIPALDEILTGMAEKIHEARRVYTAGPFARSF